MGKMQFWVSGIPAPYATKGEDLWKRELESNLPKPSIDSFNGVTVEFILRTPATGAGPVHVDNLCEPVFSVLVGGLGWFGGRRSNINWWRAAKVSGEPTGIKLGLEAKAAPDMKQEFGEPFFVYAGNVPEKASEPILPVKVSSIKQLKQPAAGDRYMVRLQFGGSNINIGDIAGGRVKEIIDSLYPVIGGAPDSPDDWRIHILQVEKGVKTVDCDAVLITVWIWSGRDSA